MILTAFGLISLFAILAIGGIMPKRSSPRRFSGSFSKDQSDAIYVSVIDSIRSSESGSLVASCCDAAIEFVKKGDRVSFERLMSFDAYGASGYDEYYLVSQIQAFFKKRADLDLGIDTAGEAMATFFRSESICCAMNRALDDKSSDNYFRRAHLLFQMSRKITSILGEIPTYDEIPFGFGPGANVGCKKYTSVRMKLSADATSTVGAFSLLQGDAHMSQTWPGLNKIKAVRGSSWTTVPKTAVTDRAINIEPIVNSYLQKGFGSVIRSRLARAGINLNDQTANQRLARYGSTHGTLATIDLSMASDTIAYNLVRDLLPLPWFDALDACRSPITEMPDGKFVILQKFSSMGNGYTFELESLIFYALLLVVCGSDSTISVYGDDLICPSEYYADVVAALELCGFIPNSAKSFGVGPFRESCGKDYWDGIDVRPVYCKEKMSVKEIYRLHNFFLRNKRLEYLCPVLLSFLDKGESIYGPDGFGDGHLVTDELHYTADKRGWDGKFVKFKTWQSMPTVYVSTRAGDYGAFLYLTRHGCEDPVSPKSLYTERSTVDWYRKRTLYARIKT
jgi:hypothetical protein